MAASLDPRGFDLLLLTGSKVKAGTRRVKSE